MGFDRAKSSSVMQRSGFMQILILFAVVLVAGQANGQTWQSITQTGSPKPYYTVWTKAVYDYQHKTLLLTQDDSGHGSGIYADTVFGFNPSNGAWTQLWVSDGASSNCPGDTASRPNHRHTYNQITWDTLRNQMYITSGSCQGALSYDWYAFTHNGSLNSGSWTQVSNPSPNPGVRQEAAMVYMPNVDRVLLYGGYNTSGTTSDDTWEYNPATNAWTQICTGCAPGARHAHILVYDDASGKVILYGGQRSFNGASIAQTYIYDPTQSASNRWKAASPVSEAPSSAYTCHGYDKQRNRVLIYPSQGHVYAYTVASNTWSDLGITGGPNPDPGAGDGSADTFCGYDYDHDWLVFFAYPGPGGGPPLTFGLNFGNPPGGGTPDTLPPSVAMISPAAGATVSNTVTVSAAASDNVGVVGVQFQLDGANFGAELTSAPYNVSWNTTTVANGAHTWRAIARDAAGNSSTAAAVSVTVSNVPPDTTPPTVSLTAPANGATVSGSVTVSANASDNVGVVGVQFQLDGANLGAEDTASPYSVSWNTTTASNGSHSLRAIARDAAGNRTTSSAFTVTVNNTVPDTTPPAVSITSPAGGATVAGTTTVTATATDNVGVVGVQFQLDGANLGVEDTASPYSASWDTTVAGNGSHTLTAIARDAAGNRTTSSAVTVTVSNGPAPGTVLGVGIDSNTQFRVDVKDLTPLVTCTTCWFGKAGDVMSGQELEVRLRAGSNPAVADMVLLKQGTMDGTVTTVGNAQFVMTPGNTKIWPSSVTVITGSVTQFTGFSGTSGPVQTGQKVAVRGLLFKSTPQGIELIARQIKLLQ